MTEKDVITTIDTVTHTIITDESQIQFTTFEDGGKKMIRIESDKPVTITLKMLNEYVTEACKSDTMYYVGHTDILNMSTVIVTVYLLIIIACYIWCYTVLGSISKIEL